MLVRSEAEVIWCKSLTEPAFGFDRRLNLEKAKLLICFALEQYFLPLLDHVSGHHVKLFIDGGRRGGRFVLPTCDCSTALSTRSLVDVDERLELSDGPLTADMMVSLIIRKHLRFHFPFCIIYLLIIHY